MNRRRACPREVRTARVRVRCCGHLHTIELRASGALVFHDHDWALMRAETDLRSLTGMPPAHRCEEVLRLWRWLTDRPNSDAPLGSLPPELAKALASVQYRPHQEVHELSSSLRDRAERRIRNKAANALDAADYRRSKSNWAGGEHQINVRVETQRWTSIAGESRRAWSQNGKWSGTDSVINAAVRFRWLRVLSRGLALVTYKGKKHFVLDITREEAGLAYATVGKQGRGFSVHAAEALINVESKKIVRWL